MTEAGFRNVGYEIIMIRKTKIRIKDNTKISSRRNSCIVVFEEIVISVGLLKSDQI